ncbi:MAG TPA: NADH-quinone oxidoreductase subunit B [Thermoproteales archaeon]|nr:NADH-quinone oxidoreductase subunit B [Thermoproteales archaeon]
MTLREKLWKKSLWIFHFNASGCNGCDIEFVAATTSRYDIERFGAKLVPSPRHADVLVVTGAVNRLTKDPLKLIYDQIPEPKIVIALGTCACSGGIFGGCYNVAEGVDKVIPVDIYIPGCPPKPDAIIEALAKISGLLEEKKNGKSKNRGKD